MRLKDLVSFREDLLFSGAVQLGWLETNRPEAIRAAEHFIFHGHGYHAVPAKGQTDSYHGLLDTAHFTLDILERMADPKDDPFSLAIAGYGTGKSHFAVTLASLLSNPSGDVANRILDNLGRADPEIGKRVRGILSRTSSRAYLVVALNGMKDFDLTSEITRQILDALSQRGLETTGVRDFRPRFKVAANFVRSFHDLLRPDFGAKFGAASSTESIVERLSSQDEDVFRKVSEVYQSKVGASFPVGPDESLQDFVRIVSETYCGPGKPFAGLLIIFDEFGRYMEFSVQKPHVAGSGALQQLFESVQANTDRVFLLCLIQYELKAYVSRVAPELRDDLIRYVTRYDVVRKVRLSTNLEALIANLLDKPDLAAIQELRSGDEEALGLHQSMLQWFPEMADHGLWLNPTSFRREILEGCWPLHPVSTWVLYRLSSLGQSLQQRSALSLLAELFRTHGEVDFGSGKTFRPVDLCDIGLVEEFLTSERYGQQGAAAHAYESALQKYGVELSASEKALLRAAVIARKVGARVSSAGDCQQVLMTMAGIDSESASHGIARLVREFGVLEWNDVLHQYEIVGDAVPRRAFLDLMESKVEQVPLDARASLFAQRGGEWLQIKVCPTDFGLRNSVPSKEWNYRVHFTNATMLRSQVDYAVRTWLDARGVDEEKGQLIYCYVGPESNVSLLREAAAATLADCRSLCQADPAYGVPVAIVFLCDSDASLGRMCAELSIMEQLGEEEERKFTSFLDDRRSALLQEMQATFAELEGQHNTVYGTDVPIRAARMARQLMDLFAAVYPKLVPFPFDGFSTSRGNAAKDYRVIAMPLFCGQLDHDTISHLTPAQKNRAHAVLADSWGAIAQDGSIRLRPSNRVLVNVIESMESQFGEDTELGKPVNLGWVVRTLCAPPYGCDLASAGMLLGLYIGRRHEEIAVVRSEQVVSVANWVQEALPGNFLDLRVLDGTHIQRISKQDLSVWEGLLDEWESEAYYPALVQLREKAEELNRRISVPQQLYYRLGRLKDQTRTASAKIRDRQARIGTAIEKINRGVERNDVATISWGAADLSRLLDSMNSEAGRWTRDEAREVEDELAYARLQTQKRFSEWLGRQVALNAVGIGEFRHSMLDNLGGNLRILGLLAEYQQVVDHVESIERNIRLIEEIRKVASDVDSTVGRNKPTPLIPVRVLLDWLEQAELLSSRLGQARGTNLDQASIERASHELSEYREACERQINEHQEGMARILNLQCLNSLDEIDYWRRAVSGLMLIYEGQPKDVEDLRAVHKQMELIEKHHKQLDDERLSPDEFAVECKRCTQETQSAFPDDAPPLDYEMIYSSLIRLIEATREQSAQAWIERNVPAPGLIADLDSVDVLQCKAALQNMPELLSHDQVDLVCERLRLCEKRLDELEVEGLLAKFVALSLEARKRFLQAIAEYVAPSTN